MDTDDLLRGRCECPDCHERRSKCKCDENEEEEEE